MTNYIVVHYPLSHDSSIDDWNMVQQQIRDAIPNIRVTSCYNRNHQDPVDLDIPELPEIKLDNDSIIDDGDLETAREILHHYYYGV